MDNGFSNEPMLDIFIYETEQNIEQLEKSILTSEKASCFTSAAVNEIFRIMHTIKGSSAMMLFENIESLSHTMEDLFYYIREEHPGQIDYAALSDLVLGGVDFIKLELEKLKNAQGLDGDPSALIESIRSFLSSIKGGNPEKKGKPQRKKEPAAQYYVPGKTVPKAGQKEYKAVVYFEDGCEMENIRAYAILHNLRELTEDFRCFPEDLIDNGDSVRIIREQGFEIILRVDKDLRELHEFFTANACVRDLDLTELPPGNADAPQPAARRDAAEKAPDPLHAEPVQADAKNGHQSIISVDVQKLDKLMDLMGEIVIAEAMVTQNPELRDLQLGSFYKAARQLQKITGELQDIVMSIRMVPLSATFHKMHRLVRDMSRKLGKEVELTLVGEETEVDKNIIEHISDPLMHLVRNSVDHGIEPPQARAAAGKPKAGQITLEAKNAGGDVLVTVRDDGAGLCREQILQKAARQGLLTKPGEDMTDREVYALIFLPGFSTNENVTEYSGRGVGMDVVTKNLEAVGMNIRVGDAVYTLPTTSIKEAFRAKKKDIVRDSSTGGEMIMVRGECYPVLRLHKLYEVATEVTDLQKGIMLMVEQDGKSLCLFADELLGQHQVVVKALPTYLKSSNKADGLAGCTLLGDGSISLILNIGGLIGMCEARAS